MNPENDVYIAIDLKSFFASVECVERVLDPLKTNLVVADESRTEKTICLAVTPSLKSFGISGRARLFEVIQRVEEVNAERRRAIRGRSFEGSSFDIDELRSNPMLELDYIVAKPRMSKYVKYSRKIFGIYLRYVAPEDIYAYSIDEVFIYATPYLAARKMTPEQFASAMVRDIIIETRITATVGIGTNLFLAKIAMDIIAKKAEPDKNGVRMGVLTEESFRERLWDHRPLSDFWQIGPATERKLENVGIYTMRGIAECSQGEGNVFYSRKLLEKLFGVRADAIIDHAFGREVCTIADIKAYRPKNTSISSGQVLKTPYSYDSAKIILKEMAENISYDLISKQMLTGHVTLTVGYDTVNLTATGSGRAYVGETVTDRYGRAMPRHSHGSRNFPFPTSSATLITEALLDIFDKSADKELLIRRIEISAEKLTSEEYERAERESRGVQLTLFDSEPETSACGHSSEFLEKEKKMQKAILGIKEKYGGNALLKGRDMLDEATARERNGQIGGHNAE